MTTEQITVFLILAVSAALMASNRVRFDIVALLVVVALMLSGVLTPKEALSGFGSSVVILVAGLMLVGEMLDRTGVARAVGDFILKRGGNSETRLLILIMLGAGLLGSVMSSTAIVAIFIPIVLRIASETSLNASRMLMPMSYAALISGMLTLIATTPNIVVHGELRTAGYEGFGFFGFTIIGVAILVVGIAYVLLIGRKLLPGSESESSGSKNGRSIEELWEDFRLGEEYRRVSVNVDSPLAGNTIAETEMETRYRVRVHGLMRTNRSNEELFTSPHPDTQIQAKDDLFVIGKPQDIQQMIEKENLKLLPRDQRLRQRWLWEFGGAVVLIHPESSLIGKSLRENQFRSRYGLHVLGIRRHKKPVESFKDAPLQLSDSLFVVGPWSQISQLQSYVHDFVVLELPRERNEIVPSYRRLPVAIGILVAMVSLTIFDLVPLVVAVLMAALAAVFTRCLTMEDGYRGIHWSSLVLIGGMLPLADALTKTGGTQLVVDALMSTMGDSGPYAMLSVIFFLTAGLGLVLSNTASAVLVAPIAIFVANALGVSPYPFAIAVLIAASAAYSTPVSTPVVTLVVDPGKYRFSDFLKVGIPLLLLTYLVTLVLAPMVFPFSR